MCENADVEDFANAPVNGSWSDGERIGLLRQMVRIRRFEQQSMKCYVRGEIGGFLILSTGQESIAATVSSLLTGDDHTICGPRGMGHALAAGLPMNEGMAELFGRRGGCSKGRGGAFSFYAPGSNHWGSHALAAAQTPLAAGLAFALKQREIPGVAVCFLSDGAVNQGVYHETLNLAGLFDLPVVFVIENNGYAMGMSVPRSSRFTECLARRAEGYGIEWDRFGDGDSYEMRVRISRALDRARYERRPTVLEIETYRYYGFTITDANHKKYRTVEEIEARRARDPLNGWRQHLLETGLLDEEGYAAMDGQAREEAAAAVAFARSSEPPTAEDIVADVYWESDHDTPASRIGRHFFGG